MILCAGLGTRLKPWTERHPKALVPVGGVPMLRRVVENLASQHFDEVTVNVHHFADQVVDFIKMESLPVRSINVSDESDCLLDTGGGILRAERFLAADSRPFLVHNVDILSNADLKSLYDCHLQSGADVSLLVSSRDSDRRLVFDSDMNLKGWTCVSKAQSRPSDLTILDADKVLAFSGIYVMSPTVFKLMKENGFNGSFPVMDFFLAAIPDLKIKGVIQENLSIIDIGKPDTLHRANLLISKTDVVTP